MKTMKKLAMSLAIAGSLCTGQMKGEVWKTGWNAYMKNGKIETDIDLSDTLEDLCETLEYFGEPFFISFNEFLRDKLDSATGCYTGPNDHVIQWEKIRGLKDGKKKQAMLGFACLVPSDGTPAPIFFGLKQEGTSPEGADCSMCKTHFQDHTERQLVHACFANLLGGDSFFYKPALSRFNLYQNKREFVGIKTLYSNDINDTKFPRDRINEAIGNNTYTLRVHTRGIPCLERNECNGFETCSRVYGRLLKAIPNINLSISYGTEPRCYVVKKYNNNTTYNPDYDTVKEMKNILSEKYDRQVEDIDRECNLPDRTIAYKYLFYASLLEGYFYASNDNDVLDRIRECMTYAFKKELIEGNKYVCSKDFRIPDDFRKVLMRVEINRIQ